MTDEKRINFRGIAKGIAFSLVMSFVLTLIVAAMCYFLIISDKTLSLIMFGVVALSVFVSSVFTAKNANGSGLLHGLILGLGFILVLLIVNIISQGGFVPDGKLFTMLVSIVASGMLGGILGINTKN